MGATTYVECLNDNYDVMGYVVVAAMLEKGKTLDLCISETAPWIKLKLNTCQVLPMGNKCDF